LGKKKKKKELLPEWRWVCYNLRLWENRRDYKGVFGWRAGAMKGGVTGAGI